MLSAFNDAFSLLETLDANLVGIVLVSLQVSITALLVGCLLGMPLGAFIAIQNFPGRQGLIVVLNSLMGVPTVIVGVVIYLLLSRTGPLGDLNWLFTTKGMPNKQPTKRAVILTCKETSTMPTKLASSVSKREKASLKADNMAIA